MTSRVERYLAHLDRWSGGTELAFTPFRSDDPAIADVTVMTYRDLSPGRIDGWTYGLSLSGNPAWTTSTPELFISVRSTDTKWTMAIGDLADRLRHRGCPFTPGITLDFGTPVSEESPMSAFVVYDPVLTKRNRRIDVSPPGHEGHDLIEVVGLFPIHDVELRHIRRHGLESFWNLEWDCFDVTRPPAV